jgi:hypothetical protein
MGKKFTLVGTEPESDTVPTPPELEAAGATLWRRINQKYDFSDACGIAMLTAACAALDRAEKCRARIDQDGEIVTVHGVPREHPLLKGELANRAFCVRTLQKLGLNYEPLRTVPGRPAKLFGQEG